MKIKRISLNKVRSFDKSVSVDFDENVSTFSLSGKNGAGKSTILKSIWLAQKLHFCSLVGGSELEEAKEEAHRFLISNDSSISLQIVDQGDTADITLSIVNGMVSVKYSNEPLVKKHWNLENPSNLILFVDASKGFSEATLKFDEINILGNNKSNLTLEAVTRPESLFFGIYRQLVKDYVHGRLIPSKPDRLLYFRVASRMFTTLIPSVELKNFSGNHRPGEFVLLGKANADKRKPLYDVREFSSGEKALLSTLAFLCISKSVCALIIDEPENHFHESLLLEFISTLNNLCEQGGVLKWASHAQADIKDEWLEQEYKGHNLNQLIVSTHSKSLIYKIFSMGQNFVISDSDSILPIAYEDAETDLRKIGLSTIQSQVLLVEGVDDNEALEYISKGKNIIIKPLNGSSAVTDTFRRVCELRHHLHDARFVFLVDSDNKPDAFFDKLRSFDPSFFDDCFVKLSKHEFENYLLDPAIFVAVSAAYLSLSTDGQEAPSEDAVRGQMVELAKESLPQVYKKELSLSFQHVISNHFSRLIWGNKNFDWSRTDVVNQQILDYVLTDGHATDLKDALHSAAASTFELYKRAEDQVLIDRCDGKQVFSRVADFYAKQCGVDGKIFKKAIYKEAQSNIDSSVGELTQRILAKFR